MAKASSTVIADFDPRSPTLLRDPKYANADTDLTVETIRIHQDRLLRIIQRIHNPSRQIAVARNFCFKHNWITEEQYLVIYNTIIPAKSSNSRQALSSANDAIMDDDYSQNSASLTSVSFSSPSSPADGISAPGV